MNNNIWIKETWVNETEHYRVNEIDWYKTDYNINEKGKLFKFLVSEYGKCTSKIYVDSPDGSPNPVGWYFQKNRKYEDDNKKYLSGCWVEYRQQKDNFKG